MTKSHERVLAFVFGTVFVAVMLTVAIVRPNPTAFQYIVFRSVLALAAGGVSAMIPGFLTIEIPKWLRAGGALAVFATVYFYNPAQLTGADERSRQEQEIAKPIVSRDAAPALRFADLLFAAAHAQTSATAPIDLLVTDPNDLTKPGVLLKRYGQVVIATRARVPVGMSLIANDIHGRPGGALIGTDFSVVARTLSGVTVDVSADSQRGPGRKAGSVWLYIKRVDNSVLIARGGNGSAGTDGAPGIDGTNGADGRDGRCDGFGGYRGAGSGGDGGNGGDGQTGGPGYSGGAGGSIILTTIVQPINTNVDVGGGVGGHGGSGGAPGAAGRGGRGGSGCVGLGGSQTTRANGSSGQPGRRGEDGPSGFDGTVGDYRLVLVDTFDAIVAKLSGVSNDQIHDLLRRQ